MLPGPMFRRELWMTSKRWSAFSDRTGGAWLVLTTLGIAILVWNYLEWDDRSLAGMKSFTLAIFGVVLLGLMLSLLGQAPAISASILAGERGRKSLDAVLTTRLTSLEIVVGAWLSGMVRAISGVFALTPILVLMIPLGGIDPRLVWLAIAGLISWTFVLSATAIATSAVSPSTRLARAYAMLISTWLFVPVISVLLLPRVWPTGARWVHRPTLLLVDSSPMGVVLNLLPPFRSRTLVESVLRMVAGQLVIGLAMLAWGVARLRPASRAIAEGEGRSSLLKRLRGRWRKRPPCGDDPVLWYEMHATRNVKLWERVIGVLAGVPMLAGFVFVTFRIAIPAFAEVWTRGYTESPPGFEPRSGSVFLRLILAPSMVGLPDLYRRIELNQALRSATAMYYFLYAMILPGTAAEGIAAERERETFLGLIATPLTAAEILRAKMLGALWRVRFFVVGIVSLWMIGLAAGALHPLGFLASIVGLVIASGFLTSLGTLSSLRSRNRAEANNKIIPLTLLLTLSGLLLIPWPVASWEPRAWMGAASPPALGWIGMLSYDDLAAIGRGEPCDAFETFGWSSDPTWRATLVTWLIGQGSQVVAAIFLTRAAFRGFDRAVGRPSRGTDGRASAIISRD